MENSIYKPPAQDSRPPVTPIKHSKAGLVFALIGGALLMFLPIGILSTLMNLIDAFQSIVLIEGKGNSKMMAGAISQALIDTFLGLIACLPGAVMMILAITLFNYCRPWVYWVSIAAVISTLLLFPFGTVIGIILLIVLVKKKPKFFVY